MGLFAANNFMALQAENILNRNIKLKNKSMANIASGEKLVSAKDGAASYAISEKMRTMVRCLGQNESNVQNGMSLLRCAEGGVQNQIDLMKEVKARVLAADNGITTQSDRESIQREIDAYYAQIEEIGTTTNYNGIHMMQGSAVEEKITDWVSLPQPKMLEGSNQMNIIPDAYPALDGSSGPFDVFSEYNVKSATISDLGINPSVAFAGGTDGVPKKMSMDFSSYPNANALDGVGFSVTTVTSYGSSYNTYYVLTSDPTKNYQVPGNPNANISKIDISACPDVAAVAAKVGGLGFNYATAASGVPNTNVVFTSTTKTAASNHCSVNIWNSPATTVNTPAKPAAPATGVFPVNTYLSGGTDAGGVAGDVDNPYIPAKEASLSKDISGVPVGSGIMLHGYGSSTGYLEFCSGSSCSYDAASGYYKVGKDYNGSISISGMKAALNSGTLTLSAGFGGSYGNSYYVSDGIAGSPASSVNYSPVNSFLGSLDNAVQTGADGLDAHCDLDLTAYNSQNPALLESFIDDIQGKAISYPGSSTYEFIDSKTVSMEGLRKINGSTLLDLNDLRTQVSGGKTIAGAFLSLLQGKLSTSVSAIENPVGVVAGVSIASPVVGVAGNSGTLTASEGVPRSYTLDFASWLAAPAVQSEVNTAGGLAEFLNHKGFRAYCATCKNQWFNFSFVNGTDESDGRPASGTAEADIKTISIDVSKVSDAASLADAVYQQAGKILTGTDANYNHFMRVAADTAKGTLTLYDSRLYDVSGYPNYQEQGAKIADGILDNIVKAERNLLVDRLVIQHTGKSDNNILLKIPRTSLDQIFNYNREFHTIDEYHVFTKESRNNLLGKQARGEEKEVEGSLDKGLGYLISANSLIGAQINHLEAASKNITTAHENMVAAESGIRDANMAQEMVGYVKNNVLAQTAQAILAQSNSSTENIIALLKTGGA